MNRDMLAFIKSAVCAVAISAAVTTVIHCKSCKKRNLKKAAFKAMRGMTGIVSGIKDII